MTRNLMYSGIIAVCCACASCGTGIQDEETTDRDSSSYCLPADLAQATEIIPVEERAVTEQLTLSGQIAYDENDRVAFRSLLPGVVEKVSFELGDRVHRGQVLATIRSAQIQELYQQKRNQESQISLLEKQLESKRELAQDGLLAAPDVLAAEHELESARIALDRVIEGLSLYQSAGRETFHILAPKEGYIIQKAISSGQNVTEDSAPLFAISNLKEVWVMVNIYASNLRYVGVGDTVQVRTIAYPDKMYKGKIDKIYKTFDDDEHALKARVVLANPELELIPGLRADIVLDIANTEENAFAIPNRAKVFSDNQEYIVVYRDRCDLEIKPISILGHNEEYTFIKEKLKPGERVVGSNALLIFEALKK